ncbi:hypothetical protein FRC11_001912 [Ceratobasidium sp. 423]|nr:hypothetical protein FRC11_001912 [Ceratobasidium sp. 423]
MHYKEVIRVFFEEVSGPLSDKIRKLHNQADKIKKENEALRKSEGELQNRLEELTRMVDEEAEKLVKVIKDAKTAVDLKAPGTRT